MKLSKELTTVTSFSKALAMILFIALPFIGFYLGMRYQQKTYINAPAVSQIQKTAIPSAIATRTPTGADKIVQNYYTSYLACLNKTPTQDCPYDPNVFTPTFYSQLQKGQVNIGKDPILCAQNVPVKISFENAIINPNGSATVVVHTYWTESPTHNIYVWVTKNDQWKIADISCN